MLTFNPIDPSNMLLAGAGPQIRKATQALITKYPALYEWANLIAVAIAFVLVVAVSAMPDIIQAWLKVAIAISGVTSVYNDWRNAKKAEQSMNTAIATSTPAVPATPAEAQVTTQP
jgi:hypothetical protein